MKESPVQRLILDWLAAEHYLAFRMNTGVAKFDDRFVKFGVKGMADILTFKSTDYIYECTYAGSGTPWDAKAIRLQMPIWIETKATKGKQSEFQKSFQRQVEEHGHIYILAKSLEDVQKGMGR